ncbi:MAG: glycosyltransferase family 9 protein [Deltaproteobacteria bacterium]|nr:glycosyltransferase family 9 protein [Deltaproteobacteria bacterium]
MCDSAREERGLEAVILGSPGERPIAREVVVGARRPPVDLAGRVGLADALAVIAGARALVTNDSGLMHAAAAFGVPVIAVFGPTDWIATGPVSEDARVIREPVACAPCFLRDCPIDHRCMNRVDAARVWTRRASCWRLRSDADATGSAQRGRAAVTAFSKLRVQHSSTASTAARAPLPLRRRAAGGGEGIDRRRPGHGFGGRERLPRTTVKRE